MRVSKIRGTIMGVPIKRIIVFRALYEGPPILRKYQLLQSSWSGLMTVVQPSCEFFCLLIAPQPLHYSLNLTWKGEMDPYSSPYMSYGLNSLKGD